MSISEDHLKDILIVAKDTSGVIGVIWGGLMAGNTICYIDKLAVTERGLGVGKALCRKLFEEALSRGVKECFGIIRRDQYHDGCAINALKLAVGADSLPYTFVSGNMQFMKSELGVS